MPKWYVTVAYEVREGWRDRKYSKLLIYSTPTTNWSQRGEVFIFVFFARYGYSSTSTLPRNWLARHYSTSGVKQGACVRDSLGMVVVISLPALGRSIFHMFLLCLVILPGRNSSLAPTRDISCFRLCVVLYNWTIRQLGGII